MILEKLEHLVNQSNEGVLHSNMGNIPLKSNNEI